MPLRRPEAQVRYAEDKDRDFWFSLDRHLPEDAFERKVRDGQGLVMEVAGEPAGILRWSLFWDTIPFCNLLYLKEGFRRRGYGRQLMDTWERKMAEAGYALVLTSTQSDEEAQHFYRALGYRDCGGFLLPFPGFEQSLEVILGKTVTQKSRTNR
ncbi:MAG: GNAT family N-acetyltransferase [Clostridia bacterium]|nr:GNAT family N-acetyltransferase [Clostridia bacterium]